MMTKEELLEHLAALKLSTAEAAQLLGISTRTLRRDVPFAVEAALRAWRKLNDHHLAWRPDQMAIFEDDQEQITRQRRHAEEIAAIMERVERRGGPQNPWAVDIYRNRATFGPFVVGFYHLQNGGFSVSTYTRKDTSPDANRDMNMIEDAAYCIGTSFAKAKRSRDAMKAVAAYTRQHADKFVRKGPNMLTPAQVEVRTKCIQKIANKIDTLADVALDGRSAYKEFESNLSELHAAGFFPTIGLVSDVARAMV